MSNKNELLNGENEGDNVAPQGFINNTEGNQRQFLSESNNTSDELERNRILESEFEPHGSQQYQYNGQFVPYLPPMRDPKPVLETQGNDDLAQYRAERRLTPQPVAEPEPALEETQKSWIPYYDFTVGLMNKYDGPFVVLLGIQNINHGLWTVAVLACQDLFKTYFKMDPGDMTVFMSMIHLPWSIKIVYGLISDNVPILGTRRKSYIVLMGVLQFIALISIYFLHNSTPVAVAALLCVAALTEAFVNVVADAIMCIQARKDPEHGSQDLIAFSWLATGIGGILGCIAGGVLTENYHPRYSFLAYSFFGLFVAFNGLYLTKESEEDHVEEAAINTTRDSQQVEGQSEFWTKLRKNMSQIGMAMMMPEIYLVIFFFLLNGLLSPDFGDFSYYFMLNTCKLSKFQYSMLGVVGQVTSVFGTMYYEAYLKDLEVRRVLYWSTIFSVISAISSYAFAVRFNVLIGVNDIVFILLTDTMFGVISLAMNTLPTLALFAKITPTKIEGTVFAFLTGTTNLANSVLSPMVGVWLNEKFVGVTADDLSKYKDLCLIGIISSVLGFLILPLIPLKSDIVYWQEKREEKERLQKAEGITETPQGEVKKEVLKQAVPDTGDNESKGTSGEIQEDDELKPLIQ